MASNDKLMQQLGYRFRDMALLELALTHRSVKKHHNNERLEFLGDAQLSQVISLCLFKRFPNASEGQLTRMRASLVKGQTLAEMAREISLGDFLRLGSGELKSGGQRRDSILADTFEAIIGAILLDGGMDACADNILSWFTSRLENVSPSKAEKDPKTRLQEWLQARQFSLPEYELKSMDGQPPKQVFHVACHLYTQQQAFVAEGTNRRKAEQQAATLALDWLGATS